MKVISIILKSMIPLLILFGISKITSQTMNATQADYSKISDQFSEKDFERVKSFILEKGNRKTYRNYDNNNPYYNFGKFQVYLGADTGQTNINNDPKVSDFNEMTLKDDNQYYKILIIRKGDIDASKKGILNGMDENEVYFVDVYQLGLEKNLDVLSSYLKLMKDLK